METDVCSEPLVEAESRYQPPETRPDSDNDEFHCNAKRKHFFHEHHRSLPATNTAAARLSP